MQLLSPALNATTSVFHPEKHPRNHLDSPLHLSLARAQKHALTPKPFAKNQLETGLRRLEKSFLLRDRQSNQFYALEKGGLQKIGQGYGKWIALPKAHPQDLDVEYFVPNDAGNAKEGKTLYQVKVRRIGPVTGEKPEYLEVLFDQDGNNNRLDVII